jgi:hypothetical protein
MRPAVAILALAAAVVSQTPPHRIEIHVLEGNNVINYFNQRTAQEPIVELEDENHRPVAGAAVLFRLPESGPGGVFPGGTRQLLVISDSRGRAAARGLTANDVAGDFQIAVSATAAGVSAKAVIVQTNRKPPLGYKPHHTFSATKVWIIVGVAAGAAVAGGLTAAGGHGSTTPSPGPANPPGATIAIPGGTTVGPPH